MVDGYAAPYAVLVDSSWILRLGFFFAVEVSMCDSKLLRVMERQECLKAQ